MPQVLAADEAVVVPAQARRDARLPMLWVLLLMGFSFQASVGGAALDLRPAYLLPLLAAWWARRDGLAVVWPLVLLSLVPDLAWRIDFLTLAYGFSDVACLLAVGVAVACAPGGQRWAAAEAWRGRWRVAGLAALAWWAFAAVEKGRHAVRGGGVELTVDTLALPVLLLLLLAVDWGRWAAVPGRPAPRAAGLLAALVALSLTLQLTLHGGGLWLRLGSASMSTLVPATVFVAVLWGRVAARHVVLVVGAAALLGQLALSTVDSFSAWALGARGYPDPWVVFVHVVVAVLMALALRRRSAASAPAPLSSPALLALAVAAVLLVLPALNHGALQLWGTGLWALAGLAFVGGRQLGGRGVIGVPLALVAAAAAVAVAIDPARNAHALAADLPTLAGVTLAYALGGWLAQRQDDAAAHTRAPEGAPERIDISALARVTQRIDQAAALRAFGALLVPALVVWQLVGLGLVVDFGLRAFGDDGGPVAWWPIAALAALFALWPLAFVVVDWMDRQDGLRVLSAVTAALLAWAGAALLALGLGAALPAVLQDAPGAARAGAAGLLGAGVAAVGLWLYGRSRGAQLAARLLAGLLGLAALAGLVAVGVLLATDAEEGDGLPGVVHWVGLIAAAAVLAAWWVRAVRLRVVLAEDHPRALLFGAVPPGRFAVRMAALLGLPSSMWQRAALRQPAGWAFLLARPLVYVGVALLKGLPLAGVTVAAAGHGLFAWGKRRAAATPWRPEDDEADARAPVLFLRSFEDDQFDFRRPAWQLRLRWFDLWSFRRNVDEAMVDEVAIHGPVVALGRPGESARPFGARRHYASHADWQEVVIRTARRARGIVLVAGESPGLRWEFDLLHREQLLPRTVLLLHPDPARAAANRRALAWLLGDEARAERMLDGAQGVPVALLPLPDGPRLLAADEPSAAAYVVALRAHFQGIPAEALASVID